MIVRTVGNHQQLITQPEHARLAGRIMERCERLNAHPRREHILLAIAEHDNGWAEEDATPRVDGTTGAVVDFISAPLSVRHDVWPRAVARLAHDPWASALVAQHALTVYERSRADLAWASFFARMEVAREDMRRATEWSAEDLASDYPFVRLADLISLSFCAGWTDEHRFGDWGVRLSDTRVVVTPDAFGGATIPIEVPARIIRRGPFRSDAELRAAWSEASARTLQGAVAGSSG